MQILELQTFNFFILPFDFSSFLKLKTKAYKVTKAVAQLQLKDLKANSNNKAIQIYRSILSQTGCCRFLFHKQSAAYQQYQQLIERFKLDIKKDETKKENDYKPEDLYEPEMAGEEDNKTGGSTQQREGNEKHNDEETICKGERKRKRKSRWGDKEDNLPPPGVAGVTSGGVALPPQVTPLQESVNNTGNFNRDALYNIILFENIF